jgi:hypothetical protein
MAPSPTRLVCRASAPRPKMAKVGKPGETFPLAGAIRARGRFVIRSLNGQAIAQAWPKRRGKPKSARQLAWVNHFSCLAQLTKFPHPSQYDLAKELAKDTGWYYRDVLTVAANGKLYFTEGAEKVTTPTARVNRNATEALTANVLKVLTPNTKLWDTNQFWSPTVNSTRLTFVSPGLYYVYSRVLFSAVTGGFRDTGIRLNGTTLLVNSRLWPNSANAFDGQASDIWYFHAGDYIEPTAQSSVASVTAQLDALIVMALTPEQVS